MMCRNMFKCVPIWPSTMVPVCRWGAHKIKYHKLLFYQNHNFHTIFKHHPTWLNGLELHCSNQKDPGSIPGEAFYMFFQNKPQKIQKNVFFINFKVVLWKTAKIREAKTLKNNSKKPLKNAGCWRNPRPMAASWC